MASVTRRDRLRADLIAEVTTVARRLLEDGGPGAVTWRGIAREVGMSPAALYTYFDSLDALFTRLIADSFRSQAAAVRQGIAAFEERPIADRLLAGTLAYRIWALENRGQFRLLYDNLIPGYEAPDDGPTVAATLEVSAAFLTVLYQGWRSGELPPAPHGPWVDAAEVNALFGLDLTSDEMRTALGAWGSFHGLVHLEVNNHLRRDWADTDQVYEAEMREMCARWGTAPAADDVAELTRRVVGGASAEHA